jgi:hypothetical protein
MSGYLDYRLRRVARAGFELWVTRRCYCKLGAWTPDGAAGLYLFAFHPTTKLRCEPAELGD